MDEAGLDASGVDGQPAAPQTIRDGQSDKFTYGIEARVDGAQVQGFREGRIAVADD